MKLKKLSKSAGPAFYHKAQVFRFRGGWLMACQNGCPNKYVPGASQFLMFKIAESHMKKTHKANEHGAVYHSERINGG